MKRRVSPRVRVVVSSVLGIAVAGAALAQQSSSTPARPSSPATQATDATAGVHTPERVVVVPPHIQNVRRALSGMLVAIDPATGTLRAPDAAEVDALTGTAAAARFAPPAPIDLPGGGSAILTSPGSVDLLSATRRADGTVAFTCSHGIDAASTTFAADHHTHPMQATEVRDDR